MKKVIENKIDNLLIKIRKNNKISKDIFFIFLIFLILMLFQSTVVDMYFDDYGNASLNYRYSTPNVKGTDFTISQLFEWMKEIYNNWGGRILYAGFIIYLLKDGITAFMVCQAFVITFIFYFLYKIVIEFTGEKKIIIPLLLFGLFFNIEIIYFRQGIYWASASILYIWPLLPLFMMMYLYIRLCKKIKNGEKVKEIIYLPILVVLTFLATFSQEQIGIAVIVFYIGYIIFDHIKNIKKYIYIDILLIITSIISYLVLFLAPGNWERMKMYGNFSSLSFLGKIRENYPNILYNIFFGEMKIFMYILTAIMIAMIINVIFSKIKNNRKYIYLTVLPISMMLLVVIAKTLKLDHTSVLYVIAETLWFITFFIFSIVYLKKYDMIQICAYEISTLSVVMCLGVSPSLVERTMIPYIIMIFLIITLIITNFYKSKKYYIKILILFFVILMLIKGGIAYIDTYKGYKENYAINKINRDRLSNYKGREDYIILYKPENELYGGTMPWEFDIIETWMKEYYNIPKYIEFRWFNVNEYDKIIKFNRMY